MNETELYGPQLSSKMQNKLPLFYLTTDRHILISLPCTAPRNPIGATDASSGDSLMPPRTSLWWGPIDTSRDAHPHYGAHKEAAPKLPTGSTAASSPKQIQEVRFPSIIYIYSILSSKKWLNVVCVCVCVAVFSLNECRIHLQLGFG